MQSKILVIETGGTIAQKKGRDGVFRPTGSPITPLVRGLAKFAEIQVEQLPKLIDSTNMLTDQRAALAKKIYQVAYKYDGYVIVHGTDTMADTAAALTFMIQGLGKPIMITGSQLSIYDERTDGRANLSAAVQAATQDYGEVGIVFGNGVFRGPRTIKFDEEDKNAFLSPRTPPIGKVGIVVEPSEGRISRFNGEVRLFTKFDTNIGFVYPMSGVSVDTFSSQVNQKNIHGFVFVGFGAGNIPEIYYKGIEQATKLHKPIVVVTQCLKGAADMGIYEVGTVPLQLGAISGGDMTMQTAAQKLMYALGKVMFSDVSPKDRIDYVKQIIHTIYAKEIEVTKNRL